MPTVKYTADIVCDRTGEVCEIEGEFSDRFYIESSDTRIGNALLVELLQKYPDIEIQFGTSYSLDIPESVESDKEAYQEALANLP